jgi:hypothetical protein
MSARLSRPPTVSQLRFKGSRGPVQLTSSFGVSAWSEGETVGGLLKRRMTVRLRRIA